MSAGDAIELRGLHLSGIVGVLDHERTQPQPLEIDLDLELDIAAAARSDDLHDTVDYGAVCGVASEVVAASSFALLEALAERIALAILDVDARILEVTVWVRKLRPPVAQQLATSGVRLSRSRA